jgi:hypothetical protein
MRTVSLGLKATALLAVSTLIGCASQSAAQRAPNGMSVLIGAQKCRSEGKAALIPDADLCKGLVTSLKDELARAGFTVVEQEGSARPFTLHLAAVQRPPSDSAGGLEVQLRVTSAGNEVESLSEGAPADATGANAQITAVTRALAADMASSPRLR